MIHGVFLTTHSNRILIVDSIEPGLSAELKRSQALVCIGKALRPASSCCTWREPVMNKVNLKLKRLLEHFTCPRVILYKTVYTATGDDNLKTEKSSEE